MSIRARLLFLVLLAIVPTVGLMMHLAWHHRRERIHDIAAQALALARLAAADHEKIMEGARQMLTVLAQMPALWNGDRSACHDFLVELLAASPRYNAVIYIGLDGWVRCTSLAKPPIVNLAEQRYFQWALAARGFVAGEVTTGEIIGSAALPFARPFTDAAGRSRGVVVTSVRLDWLNEIVKLAELPATTTLTATDRRGTVLARYPHDPAWIGRPAPWAVASDSMAMFRPRLLDLDDEFVGLVPIRASDLFVAVTLPKEIATAAGDQLFTVYLLAIVASAALALGIAWTVGEFTIGRRVRALTRAAGELRTGNFATRLDLAPGGGEFEELQAAFDHMVAELGRREHKLLDQAEALRRQALYDSLTGLPNRTLFYDQLERSLAAARRDGSRLAVLALDLDHFKEVNDGFGHEVGDRLLVQLADRLRGCIRDRDTAARLGGDEFSILLSGVARPEEAARVAERIVVSVNEPFDLNGHRVHIGTSIGVAMFPCDATDNRQLLKCADLALYEAKGDGRGAFHFFVPSLRARIERRKVIETELRRAIERNELRLHFQPQVDLRTGAVIGVEALLRWMHPETGLTPPSVFLPVAEASGLILSIGAWVLRTACGQAAAWRAAGLPPLRMAVNVSPTQLWRQEMLTLVRDVLASTGLSPECLVLEITEDVVLSRAKDNVVQTLRLLDRMGVGLAWDDFGTGYSSLAHLRNLPVRQIKIDRSFVRNLRRRGNDAVIIKGIVDLARSLRRTVTAEGVETDEQLVLLAELGCDVVQGYHCARPMPARDAEAFLRNYCGAHHATGTAGNGLADVATARASGISDHVVVR